ncbi:hypothetical protein SKAU_G00235270 [Synaphobranchus kaupii]|uniref:Uncharacterized protein n=1 Tax=Synaphobranchus kaupii TaxID=118154 RepID=A0A9Q1F6H0_SYNKA|nr:hypothetical protein SKAU_G00235270 [Synaphobranchus kaupii]
MSTASRCYRTVERERTSVEGHKALSRVLGQGQSEMTEEPSTSRLALPQIPEESLQEKINRLLQEDDTTTTSEKKFTETEKKMIATVWRNVISSGVISKTRIREEAEERKAGKVILDSHGPERVMNRIKYERRKGKHRCVSKSLSIYTAPHQVYTRVVCRRAF